MKKLLDVYLQIYEILEEAQAEVISSKNSFGLGVTIVDKASGKTLTISENANLHMHKPIKINHLEIEQPTVSTQKSLLEQFRENNDRYICNKLIVQLQPVIQHVISSIHTSETRGSRLFLNLRAESFVPAIISGFDGEEDELEHYVAKELRYRLEVAVRERAKTHETIQSQGRKHHGRTK